MFELLPLALQGAFEVRPKVHEDARGLFCKLFHRGLFAEAGLADDFAEDYYSVSVAGVVRGLHFQRPPHDHAKLVYCLSGAATDILLDLRRGSATYGQHVKIQLSEAARNGVYIPSGFAHGFCVAEGQATLLYKTSTVHAPASDSGIRWDSAGIDWPVAAPLLSERDRALPTLAQFESPFP